ncbi:hypothetical protein [Actinocorallia sp. A-T 12471]|uniref:hypothetical protein n=1 Tax=Actinocorallia sp. A-T 12471 TaxID=3089813 RepID=UPI0029CE2068|nr:hypothetical protein [Actinocorallia sp. A-T 12471]MDX6741421.1 hypothetical protein [Actinocorallia sp. A-T 12471]
MDDWRREPLPGGGRERETPPWARRARSWGRSPVGRALGAALACAVVGGLAFQALGDDGTDGERPAEEGPPAALGPGVGKLWRGAPWFAADAVHDDLAGLPALSPDSLSARLLRDVAMGPAAASVFTVQARHEAVRVEGVRVNHVRCRDASAGTVFTARVGGGTGEHVVSLGVDVDAAKPVAVALGEGGGRFRGLTMRRYDVERFEVLFTSARRCRFLAQLVVSSGGRTTLLDLASVWSPNGANPLGFEVTGPASGYQRAYALTPRGTYGERVKVEKLDPRDVTVVDGGLAFPPIP